MTRWNVGVGWHADSDWAESRNKLAGSRSAICQRFLVGEAIHKELQDLAMAHVYNAPLLISILTVSNETPCH
jgi:hypothetical protein